jgi:hypothetical protein
MVGFEEEYLPNIVALSCSQFCWRISVSSVSASVMNNNFDPVVRSRSELMELVASRDYITTDPLQNQT